MKQISKKILCGPKKSDMVIFGEVSRNF